MANFKYKLYGDPISGNCYKIRLALKQLNIDYHYEVVNVLLNETRSESYTKKNPIGKIPLLEYKPSTYISESNAILYYIAEGTKLFGNNAEENAQILQWLFFEQNDHEPFIAGARFIKKYLKNEAKAEKLRERGRLSLNAMEAHLKTNDYFALNKYTIADIGLYAYTHIAHEGGYSLTNYPQIQNWLKRVESQPNYIKIDSKPI